MKKILIGALVWGTLIGAWHAGVALTEMPTARLAIGISLTALLIVGVCWLAGNIIIDLIAKSKE